MSSSLTKKVLGSAMVFAGLLTPSLVAAQSVTRVDASRLSCQALQGVIKDKGAAIVKSRSLISGNRLSERYVSRRGFCDVGQYIQYRTVATSDVISCSVKLCSERLNSRPSR